MASYWTTGKAGFWVTYQSLARRKPSWHSYTHLALRPVVNFRVDAVVFQTIYLLTAMATDSMVLQPMYLLTAKALVWVMYTVWIRWVRG